MKKENKQILMRRLDRALRGLYHNAKNRYWSYGCDFSDLYWDQYYYEAEIEMYMCDSTPIADIRAEFGEVYTWGRSGGTLAPEKLVNACGGSSFKIRNAEDFKEININDILRYIEIIENFNEYVTAWNSTKNQRILWKEYLNYKINEDFLPEAKSLREEIVILTREARQLTNKGANICDFLRAKIKQLYLQRKDLLREITRYTQELKTC